MFYPLSLRPTEDRAKDGPRTTNEGQYKNPDHWRKKRDVACPALQQDRQNRQEGKNGEHSALALVHIYPRESLEFAFSSLRLPLPLVLSLSLLSYLRLEMMMMMASLFSLLQSVLYD